MRRRRTKPYRITRQAWARHNRRVELGLIEVASGLPSLDDSEIEVVVAGVEERGATSAFATLAAEVEREEQWIAEALSDESPSESAAARSRARVWRRVNRLVSLAPLGADLAFVAGNVPPEVVLDALAEYLVGVWLDRRSEPGDETDLAG